MAHEQKFLEAKASGQKIRAVVICNPHNPLGRCYPRKSLVALMRFCQKYSLHLLVDEIYAASVFPVPDPDVVPFESVLSFDTTPYIDPKYVHVFYSMSKDLAAGGLRIGCIHTRNQELYRALAATSMFHWSGAGNEAAAMPMLEDMEWNIRILELSRTRLAAQHELLQRKLDAYGIPYAPGSNAGFYLWVDLRKYLPPAAEGESVEAGWSREAQLAAAMVQEGVYINPGSTMIADEPGWFRIIFTADEHVIDEGLRR